MLTKSAIARKALVACTLERTIGVDARGVLVADMRSLLQGAVVQSQARSIDSIDTSSDAAAEATSFK